MKIWIAHVATDSTDHYLFAYYKKPPVAKIIKRVWEGEGRCASLKWYTATLCIDLEEVEVE